MQGRLSRFAASRRSATLPRGTSPLCRGPRTGAVFIVRFDDLLWPEPRAFQLENEMFEARVLRTRQNDHFAKWLEAVRIEARSLPAMEEAPRAPKGD
jgi:hypothetical protein